jgi:hypothetical protein
MVARVPAVTEQLLGNIPRLEIVRDILAAYPKPFVRASSDGDPSKALVRRGAHILRVAVDFDALETQGNAGSRAVDVLIGRGEAYDQEIVRALAGTRGSGGDQIKELPLSMLRAGMVFAQDVKMATGTLLVGRGYEVTAGFLERARNFRPGAVREPLRVVVRPEKPKN